MSAELDENDDSYLITVQMAKPGGAAKRKTSHPKPPPAQKTPAKKPATKPKSPPPSKAPSEPEVPKEEVPFFEKEDYEVSNIF